MIGVAIGFAFVAMLISLVALGAAAWCLADINGFKRSTHQVQFVSAETEAKEGAEDKYLNKVFTDAEYRSMRDSYGNDREVKQ